MRGLKTFAEGSSLKVNFIYKNYDGNWVSPLQLRFIALKEQFTIGILSAHV